MTEYIRIYLNLHRASEKAETNRFYYRKFICPRTRVYIKLVKHNDHARLQDDRDKWFTLASFRARQRHKILSKSRSEYIKERKKEKEKKKGKKKCAISGYD